MILDAQYQLCLLMLMHNEDKELSFINDKIIFFKFHLFLF